MKRIIAILLLLCLCLTAIGCSPEKDPIKSPVTFYYRRAEFDHGSEQSVILGETRESEGIRGNIPRLLEEYLKGPVSEELAATFPDDAKLIDYRTKDSSAFVTVSDELAQLSGIELTVACACLAKTVIELTGIKSVHIQAQTAMLGNEQVIIMDSSRILLLDSTQDNSERSE